MLKKRKRKKQTLGGKLLFHKLYHDNKGVTIVLDIKTETSPHNFRRKYKINEQIKSVHWNRPEYMQCTILNLDAAMLPKSASN